MGKTFVVMEVRPFHNDPERGYVPIDDDGRDDETWIDPRHVIDGDRLRYGVPQGDTAFQDGEYIGFEENTYSNRTVLILDPPKPEGNLNDHIEFGKALDNALDKWHRGNGIGYLVNVLKERRKP